MHLDNDVRTLVGSQLGSLFGDEHDAPVLLVLPRVLLALVQDAEVICLRDAYELAVVALGAHHALVVQLVHRRRNAETSIFVIQYFSILIKLGQVSCISLYK